MNVQKASDSDDLCHDSVGQPRYNVMRDADLWDTPPGEVTRPVQETNIRF